MSQKYTERTSLPMRALPEVPCHGIQCIHDYFGQQPHIENNEFVLLFQSLTVEGLLRIVIIVLVHYR